MKFLLEYMLPSPWATPTSTYFSPRRIVLLVPSVIDPSVVCGRHVRTRVPGPEVISAVQCIAGWLAVTDAAPGR